MLTITLPATATAPAAELRLEHSLVSLSKWESIHEKPFFTNNNEKHTDEEMVSYIHQMVLNETPPEHFMDRLTVPDYVKINEYIHSKQTATWFNDDPNAPKSREIVTNELIYYWMIQFQIDWEAQYWHVNRLLTLVKICSVKQTKPKKMSKEAMLQQYRDLNAKRRAALNSNG